MLLAEDGTALGSVGGGALESEVLRCMEQTLDHGRAGIQRFTLSGEQAARDGMICGGRMDVLTERIKPNRETSALFSEVQTKAGQGRTILVSLLRQGCIKHMLWPEHAGIPEHVINTLTGLRAMQVFTDEDQTWILEPLASQCPCLVFGAGHVGRCAALLADQVGFAVTVLDDRREFVDADIFPPTVGLQLLSGFDRCLKNVQVDASTFVLIMTRGHAHDAEVLAHILHAPAAYIGMIGSVRKRDAIYASLRRTGFGENELARVHCPVGLPIGADTPEEIAVSIVAQMIQVRAAHARHLPDA
jgi:xanthine dehydrogenase accessory factor